MVTRTPRTPFRRLTAIILALATLHIGAAQAEACDTHTPHADSVESPVPAAPAHHAGMEHDDHEQPAESQQPCDDTAERRCCVGMTTCTWDFRAYAPVASTPATSHLMVAGVVPERPLSPVSAPEPPPPRAWSR